MIWYFPSARSFHFVCNSNILCLTLRKLCEQIFHPLEIETGFHANRFYNWFAESYFILLLCVNIHKRCFDLCTIVAVTLGLTILYFGAELRMASCNVLLKANTIASSITAMLLK